MRKGGNVGALDHQYDNASKPDIERQGIPPTCFHYPWTVYFISPSYFTVQSRSTIVHA
jgi:hypothetical protein